MYLPRSWLEEDEIRPFLSYPCTMLGMDFPSPPEWAKKAACQIAADPDIFFPIRGGSSKAARAICATCSERTPCLTYCMSNNETFGIWGGTSDRDRRVLRRIKARAVGKGTAPAGSPWP